MTPMSVRLTKNLENMIQREKAVRASKARNLKGRKYKTKIAAIRREIEEFERAQSDPYAAIDNIKQILANDSMEESKR